MRDSLRELLARREEMLLPLLHEQVRADVVNATDEELLEAARLLAARDDVAVIANVSVDGQNATIALGPPGLLLEALLLVRASRTPPEQVDQTAETLSWRFPVDPWTREVGAPDLVRRPK